MNVVLSAVRTLLVIALIGFAGAPPLSAQQAEEPRPAATATPPGKVRAPDEALVLSGGGSRGLAHAGVLVGLEQLGYDPDLVVGTSIGALVGALYAAGYTPEQIQARIREIDWEEIFTPAPVLLGPEREGRYPLVAYDRQTDSLRFNRGFIPQWRINRVLVQLLFDAEARSRGDFDRLARRFRAVTADLETGQIVVLGSGDLPRAARASMAVPGVFAPVEWEGRSLVDGGIVSNRPTGVARSLGAKRIIAADVSRPSGEIAGRGPLQVAGRALDLLQENVERGQAPPDVLVVPTLPPNFGGVTFPADQEPLFKIGLTAALRDAPRAGRTPPEPRALPAPPRAFGRLVVEAPDSASAALVRRVFRDVAPGPYDPQRVLTAVDRLYTTGLFEGVWPRVEEGRQGDAAPTLIVRLEAPPRFSVAGSIGYDTDRGGRLWAAVQRGSAFLGAPAVLMGSVSLHRFEQWGSASVHVHPIRVSPLAVSAGAYLREVDVRSFGEESLPGDVEVLRAGGWAGFDFQQLLAQRVASAIVRAERISIEDGEEGFSVGPYLRIAAPQAEAPVVGVPLQLEAEARWGSIAYRRISARGSLATTLGALQLAGIADATIASETAPPDALPALGNDYAVPGYHWGEGRAPALAVTGLDLAYPTPLGGYTRARLRVARTADRLSEMPDSSAWVTGAELGLFWSTPFGAVELAFGANGEGGRRLSLDVGPRF